MEKNNPPKFDAITLTELGATLESVSKDENGETKKVLGKNYRALPFIERYKEEQIKEMQMPSKAELDEEFLKKLIETLKRERKLADMFHEKKPNFNKIEQESREEDDYER